MAMTAWAAKFCDQLDLLVGERPDLLAVDGDRADQLVVLEHRHAQDGAIAARRSTQRRLRSRERKPRRLNVGDVDHLLRVEHTRPSACQPDWVG